MVCVCVWGGDCGCKRTCCSVGKVHMATAPFSATCGMAYTLTNGLLDSTHSVILSCWWGASARCEPGSPDVSQPGP